MKQMRFSLVRGVRLLAATAFTVAVLTAQGLHAQTFPTTSDPRVGLKAGVMDAGTVSKGMRLVSLSPKGPELDSARGLTFVNSDLAFRGNYVYQGNFSGFMIWDVSNPARPTRVTTYPCNTSQGDPSIYGNLLFVSAEGNGLRNDCAKGGVQDPRDRMMGVRIFDVSDPRNPRLVKNVQTCKGSHTHTIIPHPSDPGVIYIYVSGSGGVRSSEELSTCVNNPDHRDPNSSLYRLDIIRVPLANPEQADVIGGARIFTDMVPAPRRIGPIAGSTPRGGGAGAAGAARGGRGAAGGDSAAAARGAGAAGAGRGGRGGRGAAAADPDSPPPPPAGPRNCHDVTAYPAMNLLAGACGSYGLLVDISNPERPVRLDARADTNFSLWHTATFSNDGSKVVFTDEWGGGTGAMCQINSPLELGGNTILKIGADKKMTQHAYFKLPAVQTANENCVSHNSSLVPVPGRDIMVQGWYQGGVNLSDFTDPDRPFEVAYFDRGPVDENNRVTGGSWGAYWYNGYIYSSELARGFDIFELTPSEHLSANEIAAAKLVVLDQFNPQSQPKIVWPAAFPVVRSYHDQLVRNNGLPAARLTAIGAELDAAERATGAARRTALTNLATALDRDAAGAVEATRIRAMAAAARDLAAATR